MATLKEIKEKFPEVRESEVVKTSKANDPWFGVNITQILQTPRGEFFQVSYSDSTDVKWSSCKKVEAVKKTTYEVV